MRKYGEGNLERSLVASPIGDSFTLLGEPTAGATTCTAASTTLVTPTSGRALRLRWIYLSQRKVGTDCVATVKLGATEVYIVGLSAPGVFARGKPRYGAADAALVVELSPTGGPVYVNYEYEEVDL